MRNAHGGTRRSRSASCERGNVKLYHYTIGKSMSGIVESGEIRPSTAPVPEGERLAMCTTSCPEWEPCANNALEDPKTGKVHRGDRSATAHYGGGLWRIEVRRNAVPLTWADFVRQSGIDPRMAEALARWAAKQGSDVADWRLSFDPIPFSEWLALEQWVEGAWGQQGGVLREAPGLLYVFHFGDGHEIKTTVEVKPLDPETEH